MYKKNYLVLNLILIKLYFQAKRLSEQDKLFLLETENLKTQIENNLTTNFEEHKNNHDKDENVAISSLNVSMDLDSGVHSHKSKIYI